jgi:hypothetical protein
VDAARRFACPVAYDRHDARPAALCLVVGEIGMEQEVRRSRIGQASAAQIDFARGAGERPASCEDMGDVQATVARRHRRRTYRRRVIEARQARRFFEQRGAGQAGRMVDEIDRSGAFPGRVIVAPSGAQTAQGDDARALVSRRASREIGAAKGLAVG